MRAKAEVYRLLDQAHGIECALTGSQLGELHRGRAERGPRPPHPDAAPATPGASTTTTEDLYHRLSDIVLEVPPLRARREDIPLLVEHFRVFFNGKFDLAVEGLAPEALAMMMAHGWPGNVRALEKVLREAMLMRAVGWVQQADLRIAEGAGPGQLAEAGASPLQPVPVVGAPLPADKRRETALRMAQEHGAVNRRQLAAQCGVSGETARVDLSTLARLGLLRPAGKGSATRYVPA